MPHLCGRSNGSRFRVQKPVEVYTQPTHQEIAALAYSYWEQRGRQGGSALEDWYRAEKQLLLRAGVLRR